jgi:hypothetical protein
MSDRFAHLQKLFAEGWNTVHPDLLVAGHFQMIDPVRIDFDEPFAETAAPIGMPRIDFVKHLLTHDATGQCEVWVAEPDGVIVNASWRDRRYRSLDMAIVGKRLADLPGLANVRRWRAGL